MDTYFENNTIKVEFEEKTANGYNIYTIWELSPDNNHWIHEGKWTSKSASQAYNKFLRVQDEKSMGEF